MSSDGVKKGVVLEVIAPRLFCLANKKRNKSWINLFRLIVLEICPPPLSGPPLKFSPTSTPTPLYKEHACILSYWWSPCVLDTSLSVTCSSERLWFFGTQNLNVDKSNPRGWASGDLIPDTLFSLIERTLNSKDHWLGKTNICFACWNWKNI